MKGALNDEIADELGLTKRQVTTRIYTRRRNGTLPKAPKRMPWTWTEEELSTFREMYMAGESYKHIAAAIGKTVHACSTKAADLRKIGKLPVRQEYSRKEDRWNIST